MYILCAVILPISGGSRISRWGGADPLGGANLRCVHFSLKTYAKTKEMDPVGRERAGGAPWIRQCLYVHYFGLDGTALNYDMLEMNLERFRKCFHIWVLNKPCCVYEFICYKHETISFINSVSIHHKFMSLH